MTLRALALMLLLAGSAPAAPVPKELKLQTDVERLQGVWLVEKGEVGARGYRWTFGGERLFAGGTADAKGLEYAFVVRATGDGHADLDFTGGGRPVWWGIYKFVGDELHFAYSNKARPTDFSPEVGKHIMVMSRFVEAKK